jgi:hypothetical protein
VFEKLVRRQQGVLSRRQAIACGITDEKIEAALRAGRWSRLHPGVYATSSGPPLRQAQLWAAVLRAGRGAVLSHESAAELAGLIERPTPKIHVTIPTRRTLHRIPGVIVHRSARVEASRHPTRTPPQTRVEETIVDLTQTAWCLDDAVGWLARAVGARVTTTARLRSAMKQRSRLRWRVPLTQAVADVGAGCHSLLELRYLRNVERAHGLPAADRQVVSRRGQRKIFDDVRYREYRTRVELDGRAAHPDAQRWRDMRRDNEAVLDGDHALRYGHGDIDESPCLVAVQVAVVLRNGGWTGTPHRCTRPCCPIP